MLWPCKFFLGTSTSSFSERTQFMCNSVCHWLMLWMAGLELHLCKQNLPPCIHSLSPEWLLQECKSYLEGLLAMQQPEAPSKAEFPPMPSGTSSEAPIQRRTWLKQARWQHKMVFSFRICGTKAVIPLSPVILGICTKARDFIKCECKNVQTRKHRPGQHLYLWKLAITGGNTNSTGARVCGHQGSHKHLGGEIKLFREVSAI